MDDSRLQLILDYDMDEMQSKAFKLALLWEHYGQKEFPNYKLTKLPKKGDPREGSLFKYCYKMIRDFKGLIEDSEFKLYIIAQLQILKSFPNSRIEPNCLAGEKAWKRWLVWKKYYNKANHKEDDEQPTILLTKLKGELDRTKKFLLSMYNDQLPAKEQLERNISDGSLFRWVFLSKISPYYIILSEDVQSLFKNKNINQYFKLDFNIYKDNITEEIKEYYKELYES
jgi:hypothetical protein